MKLFFILSVLLGVYAGVVTSQDLCVICNPIVAIPSDWLGAQLALNVACNVLFPEVSVPCTGLFNSINLSASYPAMYPYIISIREQMCKKCPV